MLVPGSGGPMAVDEYFPVPRMLGLGFDGLEEVVGE